VGTDLSRRLVQEGHQISILTRDARKVPLEHPGISYVVGDPTQEGPWMGAVPEADWIINLAGASIFTRWTAGHKQKLGVPLSP
jgi:NAD dependent epimerase/dehydratase family enzyme